jgi:hypothetical protein
MTIRFFGTLSVCALGFVWTSPSPVAAQAMAPGAGAAQVDPAGSMMRSLPTMRDVGAAPGQATDANLKKGKGGATQPSTYYVGTANGGVWKTESVKTGKGGATQPSTYGGALLSGSPAIGETKKPPGKTGNQTSQGLRFEVVGESLKLQKKGGTGAGPAKGTVDIGAFESQQPRVKQTQPAPKKGAPASTTIRILSHEDRGMMAD